MAIINKVADFRMKTDPVLLDKALAQHITLHEHTLHLTPCSKEGEPVCSDTYQTPELGAGQSVYFDLGDHGVGYLSFKVESAGSPPDAPCFLKIKAGEKLFELERDFKDYHGQISGSWLQEEYLHLDELPCTVTLPRRYALRYVKVTVLSVSPKYQVKISDAQLKAVSCVKMDEVEPVDNKAEARLARMDHVALKTLAECMQQVFEDGPKRDRRLWIGDLRLQALTNYYSFKNIPLVKKCLYLFAALTQNEGQVGACLFERPKLQVDDTFLFDYSLCFISCLYDYWDFSKDKEVLQDLLPTAIFQAEHALKRLNEHGVVKDSDDWWCFLDWQDGLNKQAGAQGVLIYALRQLISLLHANGQEEQAVRFTAELERCVQGALSLYDRKLGLFVSGQDRQLSCISQIWLALAEVLPPEENQALLRKVTEPEKYNLLTLVTPFARHYLVEALFVSGLQDEAIKQLMSYWGAMLDDGADCFYELFDPQRPDFSPYGDPVINSYCHAWSCTPAYFIRKYLLK